MASFSLNMASEPLLFVFISGAQGDAILRDSISASLGCPRRPFVPPGSSTQPPKRRPCSARWLGRTLSNIVTHGAIFARNRVLAVNADHT